MLYIDDSLPHVQQAKNRHTNYITCYLKRKIFGKSALTICGDSTCKICSSGIRRQNVNVFLLSLLELVDIKQLVEAKPRQLVKINHQFNKLYKAFLPEITGDDKTTLKSIFNYDWFNDKEANVIYNAYDLCNNLRIDTCIYCNRLYTSTVITTKNEKIIRPTLDHWFPQAEYPLLALSFYNLIPSCSPCNSSVKHSNPFQLPNNIHPYVDKDITAEYKLKSIYNNSLNTFKIAIDTKNTKITSTLETMRISEIYEHHQTELADLDLLQRKYNKRYLKDLGKILGTNLSEREVYRIMFGVEYEDENFHKRPLSKLKKDILNMKLI